ncbi:hypothetical protein OEZ85_009029 [Tetradesmus obliquus]|uniref:Cytochrome P450 n=1 Tax=Tetradesmus obliquus TaxID=3088 RepID=A0ABY8TKI8_TETOB|nr:hypothetical protein OEZ85_009029 [Tetradesmus obliquus]
MGGHAAPRSHRSTVRGILRVHAVAGAASGSTSPPQPSRPKGKQPPRPPELPGLMHSASMTAYLATQGDLERLLLQWRQQHGPFFEFQVPGSPPVMVVADPEAIREVYEVLQYHKSPRYKDLLPILGSQSMVMSEGHTWKAQRDAFNPGFSSSFLKTALPGFISCTEHLVERLEAAAEQREVVQLHHLTVLTTLEVICKVGFGEDIDFLSAGRSGPLWTAFEGLGRHVAWFLDNVPLNWMKDLPWNVSKTQRMQQQLDSQLMAILVKRLQEMGISVDRQAAAALAGADVRTTLTTSSSSSDAECPFGDTDTGGEASAATEQMMLDSKDILMLAVKLCQKESVDGSLDLEMLLSQMKTFFAAGHDTTAGLLGWTMWYLCQHPQVERRLAAEVAAVLGSSSQPSYQQLSEMRYLNAVLKESLRVRPPVGLLARWGPEGSSLAGYDTSSKVLLVSPYVQHMDTQVWGPDAADFRPERWLEEGGPAQRVPPYSYMPFSRGPRNCIGAQFALLEAKTILAMMLQKFEFEYAGDKPEEVLMSVTAHPKFGVPLRVRRRAQPAAAAAAAAAAGAGL